MHPSRRSLLALPFAAAACSSPDPVLYTIAVKSGPTLDRGPAVVKITTTNHGTLECRVDHVPGSLEAPLTEREVQAKLSSCFRLGVAPLKDAQIALLSERVQALEKLTDMAGFFEGVC